MQTRTDSEIQGGRAGRLRYRLHAHVQLLDAYDIHALCVQTRVTHTRTRTHVPHMHALTHAPLRQRRDADNPKLSEAQTETIQHEG